MNLFRKFISSQTFIFFHQKRIPPLVKKSEYCDKKLLKTSSTMHMKEQKGFTLIELLIVIALIAILAAAVIIQFRDHVLPVTFRDFHVWPDKCHVLKTPFTKSGFQHFPQN